MANPFSQNDPEENQLYKKMIIGCIVAASLIVLLFLVVLYENSKEKNKKDSQDKSAQTVEEESDFVYGESNLTSQDLDFWDMYKKDEVKTDDDEDADDEGTPYKKNDKKKDKPDNEKDKEQDSDAEDENSNRLSVKDENGEDIWYEILSSVKKNDYDLEKNITVGDKERLNFSKENNTTRTGIDITKETDITDFNVVKADGIDFVMIRAALRGYSSGSLSIDEKFIDYITRAIDSGMYVGAFIDSQAINEQEAIEEANFLVGAVGNRAIRYPLAINFDSNINEKGRADSLSMKERTAIAKTFCDTVKQYGYNPVIRGSRDFLISKLNLEDLNSYDVWVCDNERPTDYPYQFTMWQYGDELNVEGVSGDYSINLSFVKYEEK